MQRLKVLDDDLKLVLVNKVESIIRTAGWPFEVSVGHLGVLFGQFGQAGIPESHVVEIIERQVVAWRDGTGDPHERSAIRHIGNDEVWQLTTPAREGRIPASDLGGIFDLGCQFGQHIEAGASTVDAFDACGQWIVKWYDGENPWPKPTSPVTFLGPLSPTGSHGFVNGRREPVIPLACHWGSGFSDYVHAVNGTHVYGWDLDRWRQEARSIVARYPIGRTWDTLGFYEGGWFRRETSPISFLSDGYRHNRELRRVPATPDYYTHKANFYRELHTIGLMNMDDRGDLNSWSNAERLAHMRANGETMERTFGRDVSLQLMAGLWAVNEAAHNGVHDPAHAAAMLNAFRDGAGWWPAVRGLSDYDQTEELAMLTNWSVDPATVVTIHPLRDPGNPKRMLEHYFTNVYAACRQYIKKAAWFTEPIGAGHGVTVGNTNDVELLVSLALNTIIPGGAYTFMSSAGVWGEKPIEDEPGFHEIPQAVALLHPNVQHFDVCGHAGVQFRGTRPLVADDSVESRFDYAIDSETGEFDGMAYSAQGVVEMMCERRFTARVIHPVTRVIEWEGERAPGQRLPLGGRIARLVVGQVL